MRAAAVTTGLACAGLMAAFVLWLREGRLDTVETRTPSIMGTETLLKAVVRQGESATGRAALEAAETELREVDRLMSNWAGTTEVSRFNAAPANRLVPLSGPTRQVLQAALAQASLTGGAFDPTCRPFLTLWRTAAELDREPLPDEMALARRSVGYHMIRLHPEGAEKLEPGVSVDLGAIAKGYAVDRAIGAMRRHELEGGLVQCGGDLRVFGRSVGSAGWRIALKAPFIEARDVLPHSVFVTGRAVSFSGDTERYFTVQGRKRSHIVDPRTGAPVESRPVVVVIGADAMSTDAWSTSLSVLGATGLRQLPPGLEALLLTGPKSRPELILTPGFKAYLESGG